MACRPFEAGAIVKILIDAGAYILEMDNRTLVKAWLDIDTRAKAAVYFGADNRAWVQYRGGKEVVPLLATPFAENLDECLVYIDEAHTRGIDLKLPQKARGALTLALGQTKDHTVQGKLAAINSPRVASVVNSSSCYETSATGNHPVHRFLCSSRSPPEHPRRVQEDIWGGH